jgi:hypothetical protein
MGGFSNAQEKALVAEQVKAAVDLWNGHFLKVRGHPIFDFNVNYPATPIANTDAFCRLADRSIVKDLETFRAPIVIYRSDATIGSGVIASTSTCLPDSSPAEEWLMMNFKPGVGYGWIELNFTEFFAAGRRPDMKSIISHELGHLLGLGHSCETGGKRVAGKGGIYTLDVPSCQALPGDHVYRSALMFPTFAFTTSGQGEERYVLNANDQGRANCLVDQ